MSISAGSEWEVTGEIAHETETTEIKSGDGDNLLPIWQKDRLTKLQTLAGSSFTNKSDFDVPAGIVGVGQDWDLGFPAEERKHGISVEGMVLDSNNSPMTGEARIITSEYVLNEETVSGGFLLTSPPSPGVSKGENTDMQTLGFQFTPATNGVAVVEQDLPFQSSVGTIKYGRAEGTVTNYDGDPMPNVSVSGQGAVDVTDAAGNYALAVPGGTEVTLTVMEGSYPFTITPNGGETITENIQYPKLTIRVVDADFEPVDNAPVTIDGEAMFTDEGGKVEIPDAHVKDYSVEVMDTFDSDAVAVSETGQEFVYTVGPGASFGDQQNMGIGGVKIKATDAETGRGVSGLQAIATESGTRSLSNDSGVCKLLSTDTGGEVAIRVGTGDKRYEPATVSGEMPGEEMLEVSITLKPRTQVSNI